MAAVNSTMVPLGTQAPDFSLPDTSGMTVSLQDFGDKQGLVVVFMCPHCPFVIHIRDTLASTAKEYEARGVAVVGISSNDVEAFPDDSPEKMKEEAGNLGYSFPYLYDESQAVAKAYRAACTPDFFLFDKSGKLYYRGQFDDSRPDNGIAVTGADLTGAVESMLGDKPAPESQTPSIGCNIKWKPGNEPDYFSA